MYIKFFILFALCISFLSCASHRLWNKPDVVIRKLYFDESGRFVLVASNFSKIEICDEERNCSSEKIGSFFVESKMIFTADNFSTLKLILYDISDKRSIEIYVDMTGKKVSNIFRY